MAKNVFIFAAKKQKIKRNRNEKDFLLYLCGVSNDGLF